MMLGSHRGNHRNNCHCSLSFLFVKAAREALVLVGIVARLAVLEPADLVGSAPYALRTGAFC